MASGEKFAVSVQPSDNMAVFAAFPPVGHAAFSFACTQSGSASRAYAFIFVVGMVATVVTGMAEFLFKSVVRMTA
jgi:hypothetical protein